MQEIQRSKVSQEEKSSSKHLAWNLRHWRGHSKLNHSLLRRWKRCQTLWQVCLYVCPFVCSHNSKTAWPHFTKFLCILPIIILARSFSSGVAIYYVLPVWGMAFSHKKHLKNVGPIRHCQPPHAACSSFTLPFTRFGYCRHHYQDEPKMS